MAAVQEVDMVARLFVPPFDCVLFIAPKGTHPPRDKKKVPKNKENCITFDLMTSTYIAEEYIYWTRPMGRRGVSQMGGSKHPPLRDDGSSGCGRIMSCWMLCGADMLWSFFPPSLGFLFIVKRGRTPNAIILHLQHPHKHPDGWKIIFFFSKNNFKYDIGRETDPHFSINFYCRNKTATIKK